MNFLKRLFYKQFTAQELITSSLYDEYTFYDQFLKDIKNAKDEVIIESPYITIKRLNLFIPTLKKLVKRNISVYIITRTPNEHCEYMFQQAELGIRLLLQYGIEVILEDGLHRKVAIMDRKLIYEGSLNILSQSNSSEIMRRVESTKLAKELMSYLHY